MNERYNPSGEQSGSEWDSLAAMPEFSEHEAVAEKRKTEAEASGTAGEVAPDDDISREIGGVVDETLRQKAAGELTEQPESEIEKTQVIQCDILDQDWEPEFDSYYQPELSSQELYERGKQDLEKIEMHLDLDEEKRQNYLEMLDSLIDLMQADLRQWREKATEWGVQPGEITGYDDLYRMAYNRRRERKLLTDPENSKKLLEAQQKTLRREFAKEDPLYQDAIKGMDPEIIQQNTDTMLESAPPRDFEKLAKLIERPEKFAKFQNEVCDVLVRMLNLDEAEIEIENYVGDAEGEKGSCTRRKDGTYLVRINATIIGENPWAYAQVLSHELYHAMQGQVQKAGGTEMGELYDFNDQYYGRPNEIGYQAYKKQVKEAEAFRFMDRFLEEIRKGDVRNQKTLAGRIKHWWRERDTEKMPENPQAAHLSEVTETSENGVLLGMEDDTANKAGNN